MLPDGLPSPQRTWAFATVVIGITLAVMDSSIANIALPTIAHQFAISPALSIWVINAYQLALVVSLLPVATYGEIHGYRKVYLGGLALFTLASLGCAASPTLPWLVAARVAQGFGAAGIMSVNTALVRYIFPKAHLGRALGWNAMIAAAAASASPTFAGAVLAVLAWPWLFALNVPLGIVACAIGWRNLPASDTSPRRFDFPTALLTAATVGLFMSAVDGLGHGLPWRVVIPQAVAALLTGSLLARREIKSHTPMVPFDLLKKPLFAFSILSSVLAFSGQMLTFVSLPFLFQNGLGFTPEKVGLAMMPWPLAVGLMAPLAGRLADRFSPGWLGGIGMLLMALGAIALGHIPVHPQPFDLAWRMALSGAGFGLFQSPNNRAMIGAAPLTRSGAASGMLSTARLTGQVTGAALVSILLARFGLNGAQVAILLASCFAALASIASLQRVGRKPGSIPANVHTAIDLPDVPAPQITTPPGR
jgi:DHA2 family multidrug resistance protein-like MFS transporter